MQTDLIARLEAATGPDRELDAAIAEYAGVIPEGYEIAVEHGKPQRYWWHHEDERQPYWVPSAYTASIDAALTLVPEGWAISLTVGDQGAFAELHPRVWSGLRDILAGAPTPALAICLAALKARSHD
jgi:hypothetical protein